MAAQTNLSRKAFVERQWELTARGVHGGVDFRKVAGAVLGRRRLYHSTVQINDRHSAVDRQVALSRTPSTEQSDVTLSTQV